MKSGWYLRRHIRSAALKHPDPTPVKRESTEGVQELFEKQPASAKRRLLDFVVSNCRWANGKLTVEFCQPFDMIAVGVTEARQMKAAEEGSDDLHQEMYTPEDSNL